ncbi:hypothetical protein F5Y16DRAFT_410840 [Xylariaceae sp. FL0255]|nr:hypothetical protein F5Y16DRAFT_410840 [Xylariaceae sp. FL0255]
MSSDTDPLLPRTESAEAEQQADSHPITVRVCHSQWKSIDGHVLVGLRSLVAAYLTAVAGVALKYKLEAQDDHNGWRIPFQFSTVSFIIMWTYHIIASIWTTLHTFHPDAADQRDVFRTFLSPPVKLNAAGKYFFSLFYTTATVFPFLNSVIYYGVLLPSGHGGFKFPNTPPHHLGIGNSTTVFPFYDPGKGLFEEDEIKPFGILNIWTITGLIAGFEVIFLNSIKRQTPVTAHVGGIMGVTTLYICWAVLGKLLTDHAGLFFLDPKLMGGSVAAAIASAIGLITASAGTLTYMYGLTAMRETITGALNAMS